MCPFEIASRVNSALKIKLTAENVPFSSCYRVNSAPKIKLIAENVPFSNCFPRKFCLQNKTYRRKYALP